MRWDLADLVAASDIAEICGATRPTVSNWIRRLADFPRPLVTVAQGHTPLYSRKAVIAWYDQRDWQHDGPGSKRPSER